MLVIAKRNLKIFFRDRSAVLFSLLAVFIIIGLYVVFLGDTLLKSFEGMGLPKADNLMRSWIISGILAVAPVTTTMGAYGTMVDDKINKVEKDFLTSPLKRSSLIGGYISSALFVGVIMSLVTFIISEIYIISTGGDMLTNLEIIKVFGVIILSVLASSSMVLFIVSFFRSQNAFSTASTVVGTLIGFITGIYIPIGSLPESAQYLIKIFPISHAGMLFRRIIMEIPMKDSFVDIPAITVLDIKEELGVVYKFGDFTVTPIVSISILVATIIVFNLLSVINISRKSR